VARYEERYETTWSRFLRLNWTVDSFAQGRHGWRRWLLRPVIAFIVPIMDATVIEQLAGWQSAMRPWLAYDPLEGERLHITVHLVGSLRSRFGLPTPHSWSRQGLRALAARAGDVIQSFSSFELQLGPLNAFPNVLFVEVQDNCCLRLLRARLLRALPLRARPLRPWPYLPHVTLGFWGRQAAQPVREALAPFRSVEPITLRVTTLEFTIYHLETGALTSRIPNQAREEVIATYTLTPKTTKG